MSFFSPDGSRSPMLSHMQILGYAALLVIILLAFALRWWVTSHAPTHRVVHVVASADSVAAPACADSLNVNIDPVFALRRRGFSYYEVCMIVARRERGVFFDSPEDLLAIRHFDSARVNALRPVLCFSHPDASRPVNFRYHDVQSDWQRTPHSREPKTHVPRIPLFSADSLSLVSNGMCPASWDTLASYQRSYVLRGSMPLDSLVSLSPSLLAQALTSHVAGLRRSSASSPHASASDAPKPEAVELNDATLEALVALPHIKEKTAMAILDYRDRLGGFVSIQQLHEVWAVGNERYEAVSEFLVVDSSKVRRININDTNDTRLRRHPYFPPLVAQRLMQLRMDKKGRRLDANDLNRALSGLPISPFFWHYVAFAR